MKFKSRDGYIQWPTNLLINTQFVSNTYSRNKEHHSEQVESKKLHFRDIINIYMLYDVIYFKHIKFCFCHCYQWLYIFVLFKKDHQQDDDTMLQAAIKASMEQM